MPALQCDPQYALTCVLEETELTLSQKRLSLAIGESVPSPVFPPSGHRHLSANSANSSRHPSEDWVKQAGGLSIESPLPTGYSPIPSPVEDAKDHQGPMDEDMVRDI